MLFLKMGWEREPLKERLKSALESLEDYPESPTIMVGSIGTVLTCCGWMKGASWLSSYPYIFFLC